MLRDSGGHVTLLRWLGVVLKVKLGVLTEGRRCLCCVGRGFAVLDCGKSLAHQKWRSSSSSVAGMLRSSPSSLPSFFLCGRFFLPCFRSFLTFEFSASFAE